MRVCPSCGTENPERAKFCLECAAPLHDASPRSGEERKVVTILFCDLVGFTAASDEADPEDVRARIRPYHQRLRSEIEGYGGTVEKFIGDAVMAVFGAPAAHEDDPERAVRAGLRILDTIADLNEEDPSLELSVRIGIATGEVVVALDSRPEQGEGIVTGDVVNVAARLQSAAPVGAVVVGEATRAAARDVFDWEALDAVAVKGKSEPVSLWRVLAARARFGTDMRTHETHLVGRDVEVSLVRSLFERSVRDTSVQLVTIVGEPGLGKTRLVWELERFIDDYPDLVAWRQGRCLPYGDGIVFWALGEIVKADAGILESDTPDLAAAKLERAVADDEPDREWLLARVGSLVGAESGSSTEHEELFTAWRRYLEGIAATRPAVFVFEDLHWADPALLAFLRHVVEWSEGVSMMLVCTARPELLERHPDWAGGTRNATTINLAPLSAGETAELIGTLLDRTLLPADVQGPIVDRCGGNPLYAEEYVRMLRDRGLLVQRGATWALAPGAELPLPESIQALVAARLDLLSPERKALLQDAAVLGKVFWTGAVAAMSGRDEAAIREALHELSRRDLVRASRTSTMEAEAEHAFTHLVIRDVAYGQIPRASRSAKHRAAAEWIEARAGERAEDLADVLAYHTTEALELAESAGLAAEAGELRESARRYLVLAGERAMRLDVGRAHELFERALQLTPPGHDERPRILQRYAEAAIWLSEGDAAERALTEAIELFQAKDDELGAARAMLARAEALMAGRGEAQLHEVVELLDRLGSNVDLIDAYAATARQRYVLGRDDEAIEWAERAVSLQESGGHPENARALAVRGGSRAARGDASGLDDVRRAIELARTRNDTLELTRMLGNFAIDVYGYEGPRAMFEAADESLKIAERRGLVRIVRAFIGAKLDAFLALGRWDELEAAANSLLAEPALSEWERFWLQISLSEVLSHRGEAQRSVELTNGLVESAHAFDEGQARIASLCVSALAGAGAGDLASARQHLLELEHVEGLREQWNFPLYLPGAVRTALVASQVDLARRLVGALRDTTPLHRHGRRAVEAALAEADGELDRAASGYSDAAAEWGNFGNVLEQAFALRGLGRCLLGLGQRAEALEALAGARALFSGFEAHPYVREIDDLLGDESVVTEAS